MRTRTEKRYNGVRSGIQYKDYWNGRGNEENVESGRLDVPRPFKGVGRPGYDVDSFWILVTEGLRLMCQGSSLVLRVSRKYVYQTNSVLGL